MGRSSPAVGVLSRSSIGRSSTRQNATWAASGAYVGDSQLRSIGRRRGRSTARRRPSSTRSGTLSAKRAASRLEAARRPAAGGLRRPRRLPLPHRCADAGGGLGARRAGCPRPRERETELLRDGYPAHTTSVGWLGDHETTRSAALCRREALAGDRPGSNEGRRDLDDDIRRMRIVREETT